jgi:hypothetical protein
LPCNSKVAVKFIALVKQADGRRWVWGRH